MDALEKRILDQMHVTGRHIASIFAGVIPTDLENALTEKLLVLLRDTKSNEAGYASKMMILGALAALGQEPRAINDTDVSQKADDAPA